MYLRVYVYNFLVASRCSCIIHADEPWRFYGNNPMLWTNRRVTLYDGLRMWKRETDIVHLTMLNTVSGLCAFLYVGPGTIVILIAEGALNRSTADKRTKG